jgi:hypothetical protein
MHDHPPKPVAPEVSAWTPEQLVECAARALGKVCRDDVRAMTLLSIDELTAMAGCLIALGLVPIPPGAPTPETLIRKAD